MKKIKKALSYLKKNGIRKSWQRYRSASIRVKLEACRESEWKEAEGEYEREEAIRAFESFLLRTFAPMCRILKRSGPTKEQRALLKEGMRCQDVEAVHHILDQLVAVSWVGFHELLEVYRGILASFADRQKLQILKNRMREETEHVPVSYRERWTQGLEADNLEELHEILDKMDADPWAEFRILVKRCYVKEIFCATYELYRILPIEKEALFLQPRNGLNQSCRYIYKKLQEEGEYSVTLCELCRGRVTTNRYYDNAEAFVRQMATASAVFEHESIDILGHLDIRKGTKIIQLWHGCGIFKKIGLSTAGKKSFKSKDDHEEFPDYNKYSLVTIASPELMWVYEEFMGIDRAEGIIQPIGVSRTDEFFSEEYRKSCYEKLYQAIPTAKDKKIILYAPTYRGVIGPNRVSPDELDVKAFAEALGDDYILIFKHHQTATNLPEIPEPYRETFAYDMTRGRGMSINELLTVADICISDYSSLVFEYSLFERPMLFFAYDLEEYIDERGLYYDYAEITPGPICRTNEEMIDYILHLKERFDRQEVIDFKQKFMCSCDGHSTERIIQFMKQQG